MSKDIVECVHWDPEVAPARQASQLKNRWILLAGGLVVLAVAVGISLMIFLPKREQPGPIPSDYTTQAGQTLPAGQTEPGEPETQPAADDPALAQGMELYKKGDYQSALANLDMALAKDPESGMAYAYRGMTKFALLDYQAAVQDFTQAIRRVDTPNPQLISTRGIAYYMLGHYPEAIGDLSRAIELDPANKNAYTYRAMAYESTGRLDLAAADRAKAGQ
ncbi:MAG: tetratricopeptide repeat protein [Firmicutes bacterium]|nr:tetratricopeptide repeat protein [Bacillota bacterium]